MDSLTTSSVPMLFFFLRLCLFIFGEKGREGEIEGKKHWPATQAWALTRN